MKNLELDVLSKEELALLKDRVLELLEKKGVSINHEKLIDVLRENGCIVEGQRVKFPRDVVNKALKAVPQEFTLAAPDPKFDLKFPNPDGTFYTRVNTGAMKYYTVNGERHNITLDEVGEFIRLVNSLDNINFVALPSTSGEEVPVEAIDVYTLHKVLCNCKKHIWIQPYEEANVKYLIDMSAAAIGGKDKLRERPIVSFISCSVPLLSFKRMDAEIIYRCALDRIPIQPCSLPTAGANAPITGQGTALVAASEVLAQIVMAELVGPGTPIIATPLLFSMDMRTTYTLQSSPEITIGRAMAVQLFEKGFNIRAHTYATGTDSLINDEQDMIERTSLIHLLALSNCSVLGGAGQIETAKTNSPIDLIIDDQIFGMMHVLKRGLEVNDETLDWEEIMEKTGQEGFVTSDHTYDHFKEVYRAELFNRGGLESWQSKGSKSLRDKAIDMYNELKANPVVHKLSTENKKAIDKVLDEATKALVK